MKAAIAFVVSILGQVLYILILLGAALGLLIGVMLLIDSARVMQWNAYLNRWISTGNAARVLDQSRDVKRFVYRSHRVIGLLVIAGALFAMDVLTFGLQTRPLVRAFRDLGNPTALALAVDSVRIFLIAGNIAAVVAGVVLCFRPSLLKGLESWADRQYSTPVSTKALEEPNYGPDAFVRDHPKLVGTLVTAGSVFILASLGIARWI
ncbi:MAG TPA: hypothetical protein VN929_00380 [Burkholderiales bacterium]|nr:hypothetical protein [Burkholderiales bacterium]